MPTNLDAAAGAHPARTVLFNWEQEWRPGGIFDLLPDAIVVVSRDGRIVNVNSQIASMFGYERGEIVGLPIEVLLPERLRARHGQHRQGYQADAQVRPMSKRQNLFGRRKDGSEFPVDIMLSPVSSLASERIIAVIWDATAAKEAAEKLTRLAYTDQLTGLPNRAALYRDIGEYFSSSQPAKLGAIAVALFDLDRFKDVNDTMGHSVGDDLLLAVTSRWASVLLESSRLYRLGGDEFVMSIPDSGDPIHVTTVVRGMIDQLATPFEIRRKSINIGTSVGIAIGPEAGSNIEELLASADLALYQAKGEGRGKCAFYLPVMRAAAQARRTLVAEIEQAYAAGELVLWFQPQVRLADFSFSGAEALMRWRHAGRGMLPPAIFMETLAASPLVSEVGRWVLKTACRQASEWRNAGLPQITIAVNLFQAHIQEESFLTQIEEILAESALPPELLELEISENFALNGNEAIIRSLSSLRRLGVGLALDDLGTGHASLDHLTKLPVSAVKIDRSFVRKMSSNPKDAIFVRSLISMAHDLGLSVVAEGVETTPQAESLLASGCDYGQGYLFGRPLAAREFAALIDSDATPRPAVARSRRGGSRSNRIGG